MARENRSCQRHQQKHSPDDYEARPPPTLPSPKRGTHFRFRMTSSPRTEEALCQKGNAENAAQDADPAHDFHAESIADTLPHSPHRSAVLARGWLTDERGRYE